MKATEKLAGLFARTTFSILHQQRTIQEEMNESRTSFAASSKATIRSPENDRPGMMFAFDEIVTGPVDSVHIERMSDNSYWMCIYKGDEGQRIMISSTSSRGKIVALGLS